MVCVSNVRYKHEQLLSIRTSICHLYTSFTGKAGRRKSSYKACSQNNGERKQKKKFSLVNELVNIDENETNIRLALQSFF